jgi:hypothetical protein
MFANIDFVIVAPPFSELSSGNRALHRLCHLLNKAGYAAAMYILPNASAETTTKSAWNTPLFNADRVHDETIVVYPEIVRGNPLRAQQCVRWLLNYPGLLGGPTMFEPTDRILVWDRRMLGRVSSMLAQTLGPEDVLTVSVVDPEFMYCDPSVPRTVDSYFIYKGRYVRERYRVPGEADMICIDKTVLTQRALGDLLRRTRCLYSYDHATMIFHEALICGCEIRQIHANGLVADPRTCVAQNLPCAAALTTSWPSPEQLACYRDEWDDTRGIERFVNTVRPSIRLGERQAARD